MKHVFALIVLLFICTPSLQAAEKDESGLVEITTKGEREHTILVIGDFSSDANDLDTEMEIGAGYIRLTAANCSRIAIRPTPLAAARFYKTEVDGHYELRLPSGWTLQYCR